MRTGDPKGRELLANPRAALLFHWESLRRPVRVRGPVTVVGTRKPTRTSPAGRGAPQQRSGCGTQLSP
jgi:pyridoxamine 5'-phosphate oxidase